MTPCEQMTIGMLSAYCVALRIIETSPSLDEARRRMESVWRETRRVFDMEDERMSETRMLKCDDCGKLNERTEWEIPAGWMHISAWYHPEDSDTKYSGCADMDLCPACVRKYRYMDDLADRCVEDYDKNVTKAGGLQWRR